MSGRSRQAIAVANIVVLGAAMGLVYLRSVRPLSIDETVRRFRDTRTSEAHTAVPTTPPSLATEHPVARRVSPSPKASQKETASRAPRLPDAQSFPSEGVYIYATSGAEQVNIPGGRHDYPESTTITVRHAGCGVINRWDALVERWDERETCPSAEGEQLRSFTSYHEFFRHGERLTYRCSPTSLARPLTAHAGERWTGACESNDSTATFQGLVIGRERLSVDGIQVQTVRIRVDTSVTGNTTGSNVHEDWFLPETGLLVRETSTTDAEVRGPFGTVRYSEHYELALTSLTPRT
jgi:hypothetical protein